MNRTDGDIIHATDTKWYIQGHVPMESAIKSVVHLLLRGNDIRAVQLGAIGNVQHLYAEIVPDDNGGSLWINTTEVPVKTFFPVTVVHDTVAQREMNNMLKSLGYEVPNV